MATAFPTGIDSFPDPGPTTPMNTPGQLEHDIQHTNANDAINSMQVKLGINGSADVTSIQNKLATVISAQAADAAAIVVTNGNVSANTASIAALNSANPSSPSNGVVFIPATATAGTEINSAIASFGGTKGVVQLGKGTFTVDVNVPMADNVTIRGMGRSSTFLVFTPASVNPAFGGATTPISRVRVENLRIQSATDGSGTAIDMGYVNYGVVTGVDIGASGGYPNKGIDFSINNNTSRPYYNVMRDCYIGVGGASPIGIDLTNQANSNVVDNVRVDMPGGVLSGTPVGVRIAGPVRASHSILIMHLDVESVATATGVLIQNSSYNITMIDCYFEAINKCVQIDAGSQNIRGEGCYFFNYGANAILDNSGATGGDISFTGMGTLATGGGTAFPFNYRSNTAPIVFTASGTLTQAQTFGASALRVRVLGGGGGGGGAATNVAGSATVGGGGQAGAYAEGIIPIASVTFPVTVTIGAAGAANSGAAGGNGGTSSFAALISVSGGTGGAALATGTSMGAANGGFGGATISGAFAQIQATGNEGQSGLRYSGTQSFAGMGAGSVFGGAIIPSGATTLTGSAGRSSGVVGSGGSGAYAIGAVGPFAGGAGNPGVVIVEPIYS